MFRWVYPILLLFCLTAASNSFAATIYVPGDQPTIQAAANVAADDDSILVGPGFYLENVSFTKIVHLVSEQGADNTVIRSATDGQRIISYDRPSNLTFTLSGFTIRGARNADYAVLIRGCKFAVIGNNVTDNQGGANFVFDGAVGEIRGNHIWANSGGSGSGIWCNIYDDGLIADNVVHNNTNSNCSAISIDNSKSLIVRNNIVYDNVGNNILCLAGTDLSVVNNTVTGNSAVVSHVALLCGSSANVRNNIVVSNVECYGIGFVGAGAPDYNDVWNNELGAYYNVPAGSHDINVDPLFLDGVNHDYRLQSSSPCIKAGDPNPDGTRNDIGAFPLLLNVPAACGINFGPLSSWPYVFRPVPMVYWHYRDTSATTQAGYEVEVGTDTNWTVAEMWSSGTIMSSDSSLTYGGLPLSDYTVYYLRIRLFNGTNWGCWGHALFNTHTKKSIRIPADRPTIQAGINASIRGDTVLVEHGTYSEHIVFGSKRILLKSEQGLESTTITKLIDGFDLVTFGVGCDTTSVIEGFTIENGNSTQCINIGLNSGATIRGNRIRNNSGIGVYCASKAMITDNVISACATGVKCTQASYSQIGNNQLSSCNVPLLVESSTNVNISANLLTGNSGGIVLNIADNSTVYQNTLVMNSGGISVTNTTNADIQHNTLTKNSSLAAIYVEGSTGCIVKNNVVASNTSWGIRVLVSGCCLTATYNDVFGNTSGNYYGVMPGAGSISLDPRFCDVANRDFSLASNSPCVGTGEAGTNMGAFGIGCGLPEVVNINIGGYVDSLHITNHTPSFAWKYFDSQGSPLTKSELQVGADSDWTVAEMWQPPTINSTDTSITYAGLPLLDGTTYFVRIRVHNDTIWSNWKSAAFHMNSIPEVPTLRTPVINGTVASLTPTLTIKNAFDAEGDSLLYTYQVSPDSFTSVIYSFTKKEDPDSLTTLTIDSTLTENARYWWRVKASDYYEESAYSAMRSFYVNASNSAPAPFSLITPPNGIATPLTTLQPTFTWGDAIDLDPFDSVSYTFYIAIDSNFVFVSQVPGLVATSHTVTDSLQWSRRYWWKVRAADRNGGTTWSNQVFTFRTVTPGDADNNGVVSLSDVVYIVNYIFAGGPPPQPLPSGDPDCSGKINLADAVYLVNYIFGGGAAPCAGCK